MCVCAPYVHRPFFTTKERNKGGGKKGDFPRLTSTFLLELYPYTYTNKRMPRPIYITAYTIYTHTHTHARFIRTQHTDDLGKKWKDDAAFSLLGFTTYILNLNTHKQSSYDRYKRRLLVWGSGMPAVPDSRLWESQKQDRLIHNCQTQCFKKAPKLRKRTLAATHSRRIKGYS